MIQPIPSKSAIVLLLAAAVQVPAQTPSFEVASIKPTQGSPVNSGFRRASPGSLNATNVTLRFLIGYAYDVRDDQISGGPSWLDTDRYEIVAKPPAGPPGGANLVRLRTQALLADRFHLVLHKQTRELPVLTLSVARNGPKALHESTAARSDFVSNGHHLDCQRVSMATFAKDFLGPQTGRTVIDNTGISGEFDFTLDWSPNDAPSDAAADSSTAAVPFPPLIAAIQAQLGLKLEQGKGPVEVLIVDGAEKPAEN